MNPRRDNEPALGAGNAPWWRRSTPALAAPSELSDTPVEPDIPLTARFAGISRLLSFIIGFGLLGLAGMWVTVGLTILPTPRIDGTAWVVQRAAWVEGQAPAGAIAYVTDEPAGRDLAARAELIFSEVPASIVMILTPPASTVSTGANNVLIVDGEPTSYTLPLPLAERQLGMEHLAICLLGTCGEPGTTVLVPVDEVLGKTLGEYRPPFGIGGTPAVPDGPASVTPAPTDEQVTDS